MEYASSPHLFAKATLTQTKYLCPIPEKCALSIVAVSSLDPYGRVVLGGLASPLVEVDSTGNYLRTLGRYGGGPGEYRWIVAGDFDAKGDFTAYDTGNNRLVVFDSSGRATATTRVPVAPNPIDRALVKDGHLYVQSIPEPKWQDDSVVASILRLNEPDHKYETIATAKVHASGSIGTALAPIPDFFSPVLPWDVNSAGALVWVTGPKYEIKEFDAKGNLTLTIRVNLRPAKVTRADISREMQMRLGSGPPPPQAREHLAHAAANARAEFPAVAAVRLFDDGTLWVRRYTPLWRDSARWDEFAPNGRPSSSVMLTSRSQILEGDAHGILVLTHDELDVPVVSWYKITRESAQKE